MTLTREVPITDEEIVKALSVRCDAAGGSIMALSRIISGQQPYLGDFPLAALIAEARGRGIDLDKVKTSIHDITLTKSAIFLNATGEITTEQFRRWWSHVKRTGKVAYPSPEEVKT